MSENAAPKTEIKTRSSLYTRRPDGIIVQVTLPSISQTLADARENAAAFAELAAGEKRPLLVDTRALYAQGPGVREFYSSPEGLRWTSAIAVLVGSGAGRVIGNLFISVSAPKVPTRIFTAQDLGLEWLLKIHRAMAAAGSDR